MIKDSPASAPPLPIENINEYFQSIKDFINPEIITSEAMKINNWGKKFKSYTSTVGAPTLNKEESKNQQNEQQTKSILSYNQQNTEMILLL